MIGTGKVNTIIILLVNNTSSLPELCQLLEKLLPTVLTICLLVNTDPSLRGVGVGGSLLLGFKQPQSFLLLLKGGRRGGQSLLSRGNLQYHSGPWMFLSHITY